MKDITAVITVWKRNYLAEQLESLAVQTYKPSNIIVIQNGDYVDIRAIVDSFKIRFSEIIVLNSTKNLKYFIRFAITMLIDTEYTFLIDDDIIPGINWLEICLERSLEYNAIVSCSGRIIPKGIYYPEVWKSDESRQYFIGDCLNDENHNCCKEDTMVDFGCNSYFIRTEWIRYFWSIWPVTFLSGEDIHLSASLLMAKGVRTIVPRQTSYLDSGNLKKEYGKDEFSTWKRLDFFDVRKNIFKYLIEEVGWCPMLW